MSEVEDLVQNEIVESPEKSDEVSDEAKRQATPSPANGNIPGNNEDAGLEMREDENPRSALTTPEVPLDENTAEVAEELSGELNSVEHLVTDSLEVEGEKENGPAGSTPWPRDIPDDDIPPQEAIEDPAAEEESQNIIPTPPEQSQLKDDGPTDQNELLPEADSDVRPKQVEITDATPAFETSRGVQYPSGTFSRKPLPLTINKAAIENSARNKLPLAEVKGKVVHLARHTEANSQKTKKWYKSDTYVDKDSYSWRNMQLFDDFQRHLYTPEGAVRTSFKK